MYIHALSLTLYIEQTTLLWLISMNLPYGGEGKGISQIEGNVISHGYSSI